MKENYKKIFLDLLDDSEVVFKLKKRIQKFDDNLLSEDKQIKNKKLQEENELIKEQQKFYIKQYEEKCGEVERFSSKLQFLEKNLQEEKEKNNLYQQTLIDMKKELNNYQQSFGKINEMYLEFKNLIEYNSALADDLKNIISSNCVESFICSGSQLVNIDALWELISYKIDVYSKKEITVLKTIFNYFFTIYNKDNLVFMRLTPSIGDEFDEDIHSRCRDSKITGKINDILFEGYKNIRTGKIVKKSIVKI